MTDRMDEFVEVYQRVFDRRKSDEMPKKSTVPMLFKEMKNKQWIAVLEDANSQEPFVLVQGVGNTPLAAIHSLEKQLEIYINDPI